ncbi:hypothetical protein [Flavobacterium litorale]|uniref:Uncharacterized protein n=1 Tax=Flavobacterium litorale TaxID=2856519 RepID=A0ABX8V780_9FLAO|nr:hypothetical protein [Flavobacterium litorale]QYJ68690.1 hypothetical protein K1I41_02075 [Flavobacterium litorale]
MKKVKLFTIAALALGAVLLSCSANDEPTDKQSKEIALNIIEQKQKSSSFEKVIGTYDTDGNLTVTADKAELRNIFQNRLKKEGITIVLDKIEIREDVIEGTTDKYYYLIGMNRDTTVKVVTQLFPHPTLLGVLIAQMSHSNEFKKTCVCDGLCRRGCSPRLYTASDGVIDWECLPCSNTTDCRKTITDSP